MRFLVDTQLPPRLADWLSTRGYESDHTTAFPQGFLLKDREIRQIAIQKDQIIITKDSDFEDFYFIEGVPPRVLLVAIGNCSNSDLFEIFNENLDLIIERFAENFSLVVLSRKEVVCFK